MSEEDCLDESVLIRIRDRRSGAFVIRVIDLFLHEAPVRMEEAWEGGKTADPARMARAAHTLACLAGNVGAVSVRALALEAEAAAGSGRTGARRLPDILFALDIALAEAAACLRAVRPGAHA